MKKHNPYVVSKEELVCRLKNGMLASVGTFGITALSSYRISQELMYEPEFPKVMKFSGIVSIIAGIIWSMMPGAKNHPDEHVEEVREAVREPLNVFILRMTDTQRQAVKQASDIQNKYSSPLSASGWKFTGSQRDPMTSYMRGWTNYGKKSASIFDNEVMPPSDDDDLDEQELADFLEDLERKT